MVELVPDPEENLDLSRGEIALQYCPQGAWAVFDDCNASPPASMLQDKVQPSAREALWRLNAWNADIAGGPDSKVKPVHERFVFVPTVTRTSKRMIAGRSWTIRCRQVPLASAFDRPINSSQGKTFRAGLIGGMGT